MIEKSAERKAEIKAEWESIGLSPRSQSPAQIRGVLKTWTKDALIEFVIRAESDEAKARLKMLNAWYDANQLRSYALVLPRENKDHRLGHADPFNGWLRQQKGLTSRGGPGLDAKKVFMAGWAARSRSDEAQND